MKKYLFLLLSILSLHSAFSQELTWEQKYRAIKAVDSIMRIYSDNLSFTDPNSDSISSKAMKRFGSIFSSDATVFDDLNPSFFEGNMQDKLKFKERSVEEFLSLTKQTYPMGLLTANITNMRIGYNDLSSYAAIVSVEKEVIAVTRNNWRVKMKDTLLVTLRLSEDYRTAKIQKISQDGSVYDAVNYRIQNDRDNDFVIDDEDNCKDIPGYIQYNGCEPPIGPFATLLVGGGIGYSIETFGGTTGDIQDAGSYDLYDVTFTPTSGADPDLQGSIELELFPWRERQIGIGFGGMISFMNAKLKIKQGHYNVVYESDNDLLLNYTTDDGKDELDRDYRRLINNSTEVSENVNLIYFTPFVNLKLKKQFNDSKLGFKLNIGAGISLKTTPSIGKHDGTFQYGAEYSYLSNNTWGYSESETQLEIKLTQDFINSYSGTSGLLNTLSGAGLNYDLWEYSISGADVPSSAEVKLGFGYRFMVTPAITYQTFSSLYWNFGIQLMYSSHTNESFEASSYALTNTLSEYNTLLLGTKKVQHLYFGLTAGLSFSLAKKFDKANQY